MVCPVGSDRCIIADGGGGGGARRSADADIPSAIGESLRKSVDPIAIRSDDIAAHLVGDCDSRGRGATLGGTEDVERAKRRGVGNRYPYNACIKGFDWSRVG